MVEAKAEAKEASAARERAEEERDAAAARADTLTAELAAARAVGAEELTLVVDAKAAAKEASAAREQAENGRAAAIARADALTAELAAARAAAEEASAAATGQRLRWKSPLARQVAAALASPPRDAPTEGQLKQSSAAGLRAWWTGSDEPPAESRESREP